MTTLKRLQLEYYRSVLGITKAYYDNHTDSDFQGQADRRYKNQLNARKYVYGRAIMVFRRLYELNIKAIR